MRSLALFLLLAAGSALAMAGAAPPGAIPARPQPTTARPQRIVSVNLCSDQLVLALADRRQIAGLTANATVADMSAVAREARGLRLLGNSAEELLAIGPDLIVGMPATGTPALAALPNRNYRVLDLELAQTLSQVRAAIRQTAAAVGHPRRGDALVARMDRELAAIARPGRGRVAVYYQRRGYVTGSGTLVDDMMKRVGLVNLATRLGKPPLAQMSLEEIVAARPDFLIVESATNRITDQGTEMLHHPALRGIARISVPEAWTVCAGPAYVAAVRRMAEQIADHQDAGLARHR